MNRPSAIPGVSVTFHGAAQTVTGSMHLVETAQGRVLLDCGLLLGRRDEVDRRNRQFPFAPAYVDAVLLSHAHIDHCGNLPNLVRQGFTGPIYCTPATRDLLAIMLADSAKIQREEAHHSVGPVLYTDHEVEQTLSQCVSVPYGATRSLAQDMRFRFLDAGHLLGSAMIVVACETTDGERTIAFTGDLGRDALQFLHSPEALPACDLVISESTYGGRVHQAPETLNKLLHDVVAKTIERGGKVLVPAFSLGRAQLVVHTLCESMRAGRLPTIPIYVDSPLAARIVQVYRRHAGCLSNGVAATIHEEEAIRYVSDFEESRSLSSRRGSCILVASGGMCEAGRILYHLEHNLDDPRNSIVLVSFQAPGSLGRKLMERGPTVWMKNRAFKKWADVIDLNGFSGHADHHDLVRQLRPLVARQPMVRLVHGEWEQASALAAALKREGFADVEIPERDTSICLA